MPLQDAGFISRRQLVSPEIPRKPIPSAPFERVLKGKGNPYHGKGGLFSSKDKATTGERPGTYAGEAGKTQADFDKMRAEEKGSGDVYAGEAGKTRADFEKMKQAEKAPKPHGGGETANTYEEHEAAFQYHSDQAAAIDPTVSKAHADLKQAHGYAALAHAKAADGDEAATAHANDASFDANEQHKDLHGAAKETGEQRAERQMAQAHAMEKSGTLSAEEAAPYKAIAGRNRRDAARAKIKQERSGVKPEDRAYAAAELRHERALEQKRRERYD